VLLEIDLPTMADYRDAYLTLLKSVLLGMTQIETELRCFYLQDCLAGTRTYSYQDLFNIRPAMTADLSGLEQAKRVGNLHRDKINQFALTMIGEARLDNVRQLVEQACADSVPGDFVEAGVWQGGASLFARAVLDSLAETGRLVWLADSFQGLPKPSLPQDTRYDLSSLPELSVGADQVRENFRRLHIDLTRVRFLEGWFRDTLPVAPIHQIAVLRLDGDLYESTMDTLTHLYPKVSVGGFVIIDDHGAFPPCAWAVADYRRDHDIRSPLVTIDWAGVYWRK
jgi:O-methyltransferase